MPLKLINKFLLKSASYFLWYPISLAEVITLTTIFVWTGFDWRLVLYVRIQRQYTLCSFNYSEQYIYEFHFRHWPYMGYNDVTQFKVFLSLNCTFTVKLTGITTQLVRNYLYWPIIVGEYSTDEHAVYPHRPYTFVAIASNPLLLNATFHSSVEYHTAPLY